jgi:polysaccharide biosynthesis transport protein
MAYSLGPPAVPPPRDIGGMREPDSVAFYSPGFGDPPDESAAGESQAAELVAILGRHRLLFLIVLLAIFGAGTAYVLGQPKSYTAETTVLFDPRNRQIVNFTPVVGAFGTDSATLEMEVATELQLILSRRVTDPVIARFNLLNDPEFSRTKSGIFNTAQSWVDAWLSPLSSKLFGASPPASEGGQSSAVEVRQTVLKAFDDRLRVQEQAHSTAIQISFTSQKPEKAAAIANAIAAGYVQLSVADKAAAMQDALSALTRRSAELRDQAVAAESAVEDYRNSAHLVEGSGGSIVSTQITEFSSQLVQAEADLAAAQGRLSQIEQTKGNLGGASAVLASPVIQKLRELEARESGILAQEQSGFGDRYPGVEAHRSNLAALRQQISQEITNILRAQHAAVDAAQARVDLLKQHLAEIWKQSETNGNADVHLRQLKLEASVQYTLYESYLRRIQEISQQVGTVQPYAEVISSAEVPQKPSWPDFRLMLPSIFLVGAVLAAACVVCAELFSKGFRSSRQIAQVFGERPTELVPNLSARSGLLRRLRSVDENEPVGPYAEAIHGLRVRLHSLGSSSQTLLFCSAVAKEGKTATAVAFARQEALAGAKVLMIDADLRRPSLHRIFGGDRAGLSELLRGEQGFQELLQRDRVTGLAYLAAGKSAASPIDLLASARMQQLLSKAEQQFDRVIIDSPPVLAVADARILTALVSRTMYIVRWGTTPRRLARLGLEVLRQSGGNVLGPIFVNVDGASTPYSTEPALRRMRAW